MTPAEPARPGKGLVMEVNPDQSGARAADCQISPAKGLEGSA